MSGSDECDWGDWPGPVESILPEGWRWQAPSQLELAQMADEAVEPL
jgi:hypothetical protein